MGGFPGSLTAALPEDDPRGLRQPALAFLAVAMQAAPGLPGGHLVAHRDWLLVASGVLLAGWFLVNLRAATGLLRWMLGVALVGAAMNLAVMAPNGGMPVSRHALAVVGNPEDVTDGNLYKHRFADDGTTLRWLGDVVPLRSLQLVASPGDFVLFAGIAGVGVALVRPRRKTG